MQYSICGSRSSVRMVKASTGWLGATPCQYQPTHAHCSIVADTPISIVSHLGLLAGCCLQSPAGMGTLATACPTAKRTRSGSPKCYHKCNDSWQPCLCWLQPWQHNQQQQQQQQHAGQHPTVASQLSSKRHRCCSASAAAATCPQWSVCPGATASLRQLCHHLEGKV